MRTSHASGTRLLSEQVQNFHNSLGSIAWRFSDLGPITMTSRRVKLVPRTSRKSLKANVQRLYKISFSHFHGFLHNLSMLLILLISRFHYHQTSPPVSHSATLNSQSNTIRFKFIYDLFSPSQGSSIIDYNQYQIIIKFPFGKDIIQLLSVGKATVIKQIHFLI